jgi:hypothetical protein
MASEQLKQRKHRDTESLVRVSSSFLADIIESVEGLRKDVSQLREKSASLAFELLRFQENSGSGFLRFPKLPMEIRRIIWTLAHQIPQLIILCDHGELSGSKRMWPAPQLGVFYRGRIPSPKENN